MRTRSQREHERALHRSRTAATAAPHGPAPSAPPHAPGSAQEAPTVPFGHVVHGPNSAHGVRETGPKLYRRRGGRLVSGVCSGISDHLGVSVLSVRATFAVLAAFGGAGVFAYGLLWIFVPQSAGAEPPVTDRERQQGLGLIILGLGLAVAVGLLGILPGWLTGPLGVALVGAAVVWREADESQRRRWREGARSGMAGAVLGGGGGRAAMVRIISGAALVVIGAVVFLGGSATASDLQFAMLSTITALIGAAVLTVPWWMRLMRDLDVERAGRVRSQERAEIAAHLHDSVLQTLALIQKQADSEREVRRLARGQERELRTWLYGPDGYGRADGDRPAGPAQPGDAPPQTLSAQLTRACGEVEDAFAITVQQVVVGDCELDEPLTAALAAAREAVVNAAKHAGVGEVSVYAEVEPDRVSIFVRDRGAGFDPERVSDDRHGLADSIKGRMERNGGSVRIKTAPGSGTEVQMDMPRKTS
ncbi:signal transduction histidine kinase/phage shock protein PspC (stress-responsive transcriptional regulator) [Saccharopolyspora gloriosae]|uniref:Signal transduction histidine kinase/phage shock protein PspC (Stress-responsive transcriptional regulator) n=1 Tax=Saccharopolyspora gloriosae TaxID=455344 RepID=A0A840NPL8_9PSEU|nr:signal transduction histidine kinase/phage shock protein PspC (stress-responsive transcriptional regulator) [Saccharopolyspora gloriosae]